MSIQLYNLELLAIAPDAPGKPITWLWLWWKDQDRSQDGLVKTGDTARLHILEAYGDAVRWAMTSGPLDLAHSVMTLDGIGYQL